MNFVKVRSYCKRKVKLKMGNRRKYSSPKTDDAIDESKMEIICFEELENKIFFGKCNFYLKN